MKTQDIKNMASAYMQVLEKKTLDPVNPDELKGTHAQRKDKDIDNDGDVDKSDEYLHNRRKAVKQAMKKEEVEELDELSKDTLSSYHQKSQAAMSNALKTNNPKELKKIGKRLTGSGRAYQRLKKEEVDLDEGILKSFHTIAKKPWSQTVRDSKGTAGEYSQIAKGKDFTVWTGYSGSLKKQVHYVVRDDKIIGSGWAMNSALKDAGLKDKDLTARSKFAAGSILNKGMKESTETLDEVSTEKLRDYASAALQDKNKAKADKRWKYAGKAMDKIADREVKAAHARKYNKMEEVELDEFRNTQESINMSMREKLQLQKEAILEREMTAAEKKKREEIVLAMKDKTDDFKSKYGKRWKDVMYATATKQAMKEADEVLGKAKRRTSTCESTAPRTVYDRIKENRAAHYKGAAPGDPKMMDKMTASDKAFIDAHSANELDGINSGIDGAKAAEDTAKNAASQVKAGAGMNRTGDQKTGDKNVVKSTEAK